MPTQNQMYPGDHTWKCLTTYLATHDPACPCNNYWVDTLLYVAALSAMLAGCKTGAQREAIREYGRSYEDLYSSWGQDAAPWSLASYP